MEFKQLTIPNKKTTIGRRTASRDGQRPMKRQAPRRRKKVLKQAHPRQTKSPPGPSLIDPSPLAGALPPEEVEKNKLKKIVGSPQV